MTTEDINLQVRLGDTDNKILQPTDCVARVRHGRGWPILVKCWQSKYLAVGREIGRAHV